MNIIVFSKDRSLQLELFLRSFNKYVINSSNYKINILYTYSDNIFKQGYDKLIKEYSNYNFVKENNFKLDLINLIDKNKEYTVFFVDDNIFKNKIDFYDKQEQLFKENLNILCRSLRLHNNLKRCYPANLTYSKFPIFEKIDNNLIFKWVKQQGDYSYPMSLDGHIFRTNDILPLLKRLNYQNPNSLELNMSINPINKIKMICYNKSIIINNPCNIVQTNNSNLHGNENIYKLNQEFLSGKRISLINIDGIDSISCHQEIKIILE
jgi:hypothetical protein